MNKKGISLVALVITIIVLVILTTTVVMLATGENGIIQRAQNAIEANNRAAAMEKVILEVSNIKMEIAGTGQTIAQYLYDETVEGDTTKGAIRRAELEEKGIFMPDTLPEGQELVFTVEEYVITTDLNGKVNAVVINGEEGEGGDNSTLPEDPTIPYTNTDTAILVIDVSENETTTNKVYAKVYENDNGGLDLVISGTGNMGSAILNRDTTNTSIVQCEETGNYYLNAYTFDNAYIEPTITGLDFTFMKSECYWWSSVMKKITVPSTVTNISSSEFYAAHGLEELTINAQITEISDYSENYNLNKLILPESLKTIEAGAFNENPELTVTLPNNLEYIGSEIYEHSEVYYTPFVDDMKLSNGKYLFKVNSEVTSFVIPNNTTVIAGEAFSGCKHLTSVTIPNSVLSIGDYAFARCNSLESMIIPNSVKRIGSYAFNNCDSLSSITIPNSVTTIGSSAFWDTSATSVTINYNGTRAEWELIDKSINWALYDYDKYYNYYKAFSIVCTDGTITIPSRTVAR